MTDDRIGAHLRCSFCHKLGSEVAHMVCGPTPDIAICSECVALVGEIMREEDGESPGEPGARPSPSREPGRPDRPDEGYASPSQ